MTAMAGAAPWSIRFGARGAIVEELERAVGIDAPTGVFGPALRDALRHNGVNGGVTAETWQKLTGEDPPSRTKRLLAGLGALHGRTWGTVQGNVDGCGLSIGIHPNFNASNGKFWAVISKVREQVLRKHTSKEMAAHLLVDPPAQPVDRVKWAIDLCSPKAPARLVPVWEKALSLVSNSPDGRAAQQMLLGPVLLQVNGVIESGPFAKEHVAGKVRLALLLLDIALNEGLPIKPPRTLTLGTAMSDICRLSPEKHRERRRVIVAGQGSIGANYFNLETMGL